MQTQLIITVIQNAIIKPSQFANNIFLQLLVYGM